MSLFSVRTFSLLATFGIASLSCLEAAYYDNSYQVQNNFSQENRSNPQQYTNGQAGNSAGSQYNQNNPYNQNNQNNPNNRNYSNNQNNQRNSNSYTIADEDRNDPGFRDNPYYEFRQYRRGDWDNNENWRYYRYAYLNGETQPEYYRNTHIPNRGGIGYDADVTVAEPKGAFSIPDRGAAESYYFRARRGQASNEQRYQQRQDQYYQENNPYYPYWDTYRYSGDRDRY